MFYQAAVPEITF